MATPILLQRRWVGDLPLVRAVPRGAFSSGDADLVRAFANQASLSLENAWLHERAREQATTDPPTGLLNHRALKERIDDELPRTARQERGLYVLVLDIDHFKAFNDTVGHAASDAALRALAGAQRHVLRRGDCAARYGGEEFVRSCPIPTRRRARRWRSACARYGWYRWPTSRCTWPSTSAATESVSPPI